MATQEPIESKWIKCLSTKGNIRGVAIQATDLVQKVTELHDLKGDSAKNLGEALMGALLLASFCKGGERINLNIRGSKRIKQALVDAHPDGTVRGYIIERELLEGPDDPDFGPWGEGLLSVLRTKGTEKEMPYIGTVPLVTGHLAKDLTFYWHQSEQIPSAVGLAVRIENGCVTAAGGFLVQVLPGAAPEEVRAVEQHIHQIHSLAESVGDHQEPTYLLSQIFQSTAFILVEEKRLEFKCNCSWERVNRALVLTGADELKAMLEEQGSASVTCDFCTTQYNLDKEGLQKLISEALKSHSSV